MVRRVTDLSWDRLLVRAGTAVARRQQRLLAGHGLSPTALALLAALDVADGLSHRELAAELDVSPATLTPVVDALDAAGCLVRARDPRDRRGGPRAAPPPRPARPAPGRPPPAPPA